MLTTCRRWLAYYIEENQIDWLKETISLPGIARTIMYRAAARYPHFMGFSLTDPKHPNLEKLVMTDNLCGEPSQIFTRHHESEKFPHISIMGCDFSPHLLFVFTCDHALARK